MPPCLVIGSQGLPQPNPSTPPNPLIASWEVKGSSFTGIFDSQARLWLPGQRGALAPGEALLDVCQAPGGHCATLSCLWTQRRTSVELQVTQLLSGGQTSGQASTRWRAAFYIPSTEVAEAEDEAWCCVLRCCGTSGQESVGAVWGQNCQRRGPGTFLKMSLCCSSVHAQSQGLWLFLPTQWWPQGQR